MAFDEEKHRKIEDYLDNRLKGESRKKFEEEMQADDQLSKEVDLHRDMEELLSDSTENALRKNLSLLAEEATKNPKNASNKWVIVLLIPILLTVGWWFLKGDNDTSPATKPVPETEKIVPAPPEQNSDSKPVEENLIPPAEREEESSKEPEVKPATPPPSPGRKRGQREPAPRAIAANFVPNPSLEFLIENNLRDADVSVKLTKKQQDTQSVEADALIPFEIKLQLQSRANMAQQDFKLHLFSNDRQAFDDFAPLSSSDLTIVPLEADVYEINFAKSFSLQPGLYYYLVEDFSEEKIYLVEKFEVQ